MPHNDDNPSQILIMSGLWTHAMTRCDDPILASSGILRCCSLHQQSPQHLYPLAPPPPKHLYPLLRNPHPRLRHPPPPTFRFPHRLLRLSLSSPLSPPWLNDLDRTVSSSAPSNPGRWYLLHSIIPPYLGDVLTTGNTFDSKSLGGIYPPLGAASCDAGNPTKNTDASTLSVHSSHALTSLSALPFAY
ncbi:hypothetical protein IEQ34_019569 [Dendrobium chrysotoxum]|uniref:Uncharacterized protein n=1 Tax=Dendrobium chrysotoxum TaxID=161865 RepID=A0AAV7G909_DENCH|nr:hypothetical protein IEQ34_019569 [Dendrobium chrysotoxum]